MAAVYSKSLDDLAEPLRSAVKGLVAEAGPGVVTWTGTYRNREAQAELRVRNGCPADPTAPASSCRIPTAPPGTSLHETGNAIDFTNTDAVLRVVERLAPKYRIHRIRSERWHYEHDDGPGASSGPSAAASAPADDDEGGGGISELFGTLSSGAFWLRVLTIFAGVLMVGAGLALVRVELTARALS